MALVMVTAPYPAGSRASISPPAAVLEIAPANVLHGAVRLQGLASSPTPDTHVRVACAKAELPTSTQAVNTHAVRAKRIIMRPPGRVRGTRHSRAIRRPIREDFRSGRVKTADARASAGNRASLL